MRLLVIGHKGQVTSSLMLNIQKKAEIIQIGRPEFDLQTHKDFREFFLKIKPDIVVNPAAYTSVEKAESEPETVFAINAYGAGYIASAAAHINVPCIYLSTDYVFDGSQVSPIDENTTPRPLNVYGKSKLAGEEMVISHTDNYVILRTGWIYSPFNSNFLLTMLKLAETQSEINVVSDQFGTPTSALHIADSIFKIARNLIMYPEDKTLRGIFNITARGGPISWAQFAEQIFTFSGERGGPVSKVRHISTKDYTAAVQRPKYSCLDFHKLEKIHDVRHSLWKDELREVFTLLN
ncbi:dTDP-4-dehydrorhamnose reductase [Liberibacter crescens BT-1]|uniref:dTDP-4-dehydrorhamnose reductase n=1 Tax=Liberibacter crescens (strain BT-1) TaxID=1215343 RepID=L0EVV7_LIBCB|nr:dTDP-4-dehydrorhamnose reductase [Liberibacter crescens]AGA64990.1 dTDP-4-dehydrorhamnose reductase [Liberibacter crescens BT-1]AMC13006.1 dTDP-4-dehydrorhamnose reductase [Liberibacter crescens]